MIPDNRLSTTVITAPLLLPDPQPAPYKSHEWGGVALNNSSQGLFVKIWTCEVIGDNIVIYAEDVEPIILLNVPGTTQCSLAFDQNMRPFVAFVQAGQAKYYWYDSLIEQAVTTNLPSGSTYPRATLDDHRNMELNTSDIIMVYLRDGNLYYRQQRDRYLDELLLYPDINTVVAGPRVEYVVMNAANRLQIMLGGSFYGQN